MTARSSPPLRLRQRRERAPVANLESRQSQGLVGLTANLRSRQPKGQVIGEQGE